MSTDLEPIDSAPPARREPPIVVFIAAVAGLTLAAAAGGGTLGRRLSSHEAPQAGEANAAQTKPAQARGALYDLPPIVVNLADPPTAWARVQASIVLDGEAGGKPEILAAQIAEDVLGFLRTLSLGDIAGAGGLQHLREDLNERAAVRSNGRVRELILQTLVVQ